MPKASTPAERWRRLVTGLIEATQSGRLKWQPSDTRGAFLASLSQGTIVINKPELAGVFATMAAATAMADPVRLELLDSTGTLVDQYVASATPRWMGAAAGLPHADLHRLATELYDLAGRDQVRADELVDRILRDL